VTRQAFRYLVVQRLEGGTAVSRDTSVEARLAALEKNVEILTAGQEHLTNQLTQEATKRDEAIKAERQAREASLVQLRTVLDNFGAGGLNLERIGIVWFLLGVVLSSVSSGISML
jgi:hypothetical protein